MAIHKVLYGTATKLVGTLTGLAPSRLSGFRFASISNVTDGWQSFEIGVKTLGASEAKGFASIYLYRSIDDGVTWESGSNTAGLVTLTGSEKPLGTIPIVDGKVTTQVISLRGTSSRTPEFYPPKMFGLIFTNESEVELPDGCEVWLTGIRTEVI